MKALLLLVAPVYALATCPAGLSATNAWSVSTLPGHAPDKQSYWTGQVGAQAEWRPGFAGAVEARVWFYKIVHTSGNDADTRLAITHAGGTEERTVNANSGDSGWVDLGRYEFAGTCEERVLLTKRTPVVSTRFSAVRFDVYSQGQVIGSVLLDEITGNAPGLLTVTWPDLAGSPFRNAVERLGFRGLVEGVASREFGADQPIVEGEYALWLMRALGRLSVEEGEAKRKPSTAEQRANAAEMARAAGLIDVVDAERAMSREDLARMTMRAIGVDGANLDWLARRPSEQVPAGEYLRGLGLVDREFDEGGGPTRLQAALLLRRFVDAFVDGGPPRDRKWRMTYHDEFEGDALNRSQWAVESGSPTHILSSRWPENVEVRGGLLRLLTRKENRGGKQWTTGNIWSTFRQQYGYFEARMRIGAAPGLNNAFWLMTGSPIKFEIDITEAHFPRRHTYTVHDYGPPRTSVGRMWTSNSDLSEDFHVFAALWDEQALTFYVDGKQVGRTACAFCREATPLRFSSAVLAWAGAITDALDGTQMEVDWVRVYLQARQPE